MNSKAPTAYPETVKRFIEACGVDIQAKAYLDLAFHSGLRPQELCDLDWSDIDLVARTVHVRNGKGGFARTVAIACDYGYIAIWRERCGGIGPVFKTRTGKAWTTFQIQRKFQALSKRVGERLTPYSLRHGCAVAVAEVADRESNSPLATVATVQRQLGHRYMGTSYTYLSGLRGKQVARMAF